MGYNATTFVRAIFKKTGVAGATERIFLGVFLDHCQDAVPTTFDDAPGKIIFRAVKVNGALFFVVLVGYAHIECGTDTTATAQ